MEKSGAEILILKNMKTLKLILIVLIAAFATETQAQTIIGKVENGKGTITIKETTLKAKWEKYLETEGIKDANIGDFAIHQSSEGTYYVTCTDNTERGDSKTGILMSKYGITLIMDGTILKAGETSCKCETACLDGCNPVQSGFAWSCTRCQGYDEATCTKTVTATVGSGLF